MPFLAVGPSAGSLAEIPAPTDITWGLQDVSGSDAGRVQDAGNTMYKMRTSQKRKLSLSWKDPDGEQAAAILQAFNPEYVHVRYFDPMANAYQIRVFYVGDRSAPFRSFQLGSSGACFTTLSFDIIER